MFAQRQMRDTRFRTFACGMSTACAAKRTSTSPSSQRISSFVVRSVMRGGPPGVGLALVEMLLRELLWIRSGSCAEARLELVG